MANSKKVWNVANLITFVRLILGFPLIYLVIVGEKWFAVVFYGVFLLLDILDGFLARRFRCETLFGKNFDFIIDGIVGLGVVVVLIINGIIPLLYVGLISIAVIAKSVGVVWGVRLMKKTFIQSKWKKLNGAVFFSIPLLFLVDWALGANDWVVLIAYLLLIYVYVSTGKYLFEIWRVRAERK